MHFQCFCEGSWILLPTTPASWSWVLDFFIYTFSCRSSFPVGFGIFYWWLFYNLLQFWCAHEGKWAQEFSTLPSWLSLLLMIHLWFSLYSIMLYPYRHCFTPSKIWIPFISFYYMTMIIYDLWFIIWLWLELPMWCWIKMRVS